MHIIQYSIDVKITKYYRKLIYGHTLLLIHCNIRYIYTVILLITPLTCLLSYSIIVCSITIS